MNLEFPVTSDPIDPKPTPIITAKMPFSGLLLDNKLTLKKLNNIITHISGTLIYCKMCSYNGRTIRNGTNQIIPCIPLVVNAKLIA